MFKHTSTVALVGVLLFASFLLFLVPTTEPISAPADIPISGAITVEHSRGGVVLSTYTSPNLITNIGREHVETLLRTTNPVFPATIHISLSSNTTNQTAVWTILPEEITTGGLARATGTVTDMGVGAWRVSNTFTATAPHTNVRLTGIHWSPTSNSNLNMLAAANFTPVGMIPGDVITARWDFTATSP